MGLPLTCYYSTIGRRGRRLFCRQVMPPRLPEFRMPAWGCPPVKLCSDHDEQATVVDCAPLFEGVHGSHLHAPVEAARGEDVVQLVVACCRWVFAGEVERDHVAGVRGFVRRWRLRLSPVRRRRPYELQPNGRHPLEHRPVACLPVRRTAAIAVAVRDVEVAGGQDTIPCRTTNSLRRRPRKREQLQTNRALSLP